MDRFLRSKEIAEILGTGPGVAASMLAKYGVHPVDFGYGAYRGRRWLESAVRAAMLEMHTAAQSATKPSVRRPPKSPKNEISLCDMSADDLYNYLTHGQTVQ